MARTSDVIVVGGGIIGLTTAIVLRRAGVRVAVYDRGEFGREASWAGAGIIPPGNPEFARTPIDRLRAIGSQGFPEFSAELKDLTGIDNGYRVNGGVELLSREDEYAIELWNAERIAYEAFEPSPVAGIRSYYLPGMAQLRNPWHMRALLSLAQQLEIALHPNTRIARWEIEAGRVAGVLTEQGERLSAEKYLLASGAWSEPLLNALGCRIGIHPVRGQILLLRTACESLRATHIMGKRYLVPRGDGLVLVGSTEEPEAGFAKATTPDALHDLRVFACRMIPALADAATEAAWSGLRPGSPDGCPYLGPVPGYENVHVAVGHSRAGVQLSLGTAMRMRDLMLHHQPPSLIDEFAVNREPAPIVRPAFRS